jgi:hypothetical protein
LDDYEGEGPEFEKEPEGYEEEEDEEMQKERVHRPGRTAAQHEGDWPMGSDDDPAPGKGPPKNTRADGYVSGDEMTPERASEILQPYAQDEEDDDEDEQLQKVQAGADALAARLAKRFPRATNGAIEKAVEGAVHSTHASFDPVMGREREYMKRVVEKAAPMYKTYTDGDLVDRLEKRFRKAAVANHFGWE